MGRGCVRGNSRKVWRWMRPLRAPFSAENIARFYSHVDKDGPIVRPELGPCWLWTAKLKSNGYGQFGVGRQFRMHAHRYAWLANGGAIQHGQMVLHKCDVKHCMRHLYIGSHEDNTRDAINRNRFPRGDANGARRHVDRVPRGDTHWTKKRPESVPRGDAHWSARHPEKVYRKGAPKIDRTDVQEIRSLREQGVTFSAIAARFSLSQAQVFRIVHRQRWKDA